MAGNKAQRMTKREWHRVLFGGDLPADSAEAVEQLKAVVSDADEPVVEDAALLGALIAVAEGGDKSKVVTDATH